MQANAVLRLGISEMYLQKKAGPQRPVFSYMSHFCRFIMLQIIRICGIINLALKKRADVAQSVERILGKDEVTGSNPVISSTNAGI